MGTTELLFPRVVEASDETFEVQRELAYWQYNTTESQLLSGQTEQQHRVEVLNWYNEAIFAVRSLTRAGIEDGLLSEKL